MTFTERSTKADTRSNKTQNLITTNYGPQRKTIYSHCKNQSQRR